MPSFIDSWEEHFNENKADKSLILVFPSIVNGISKDKVARLARLHCSANMTTAEGRTGRAYAIPVSRYNPLNSLLVSRSLTDLKYSISRFIVYSNATPSLNFLVAPIGMNQSGYSSRDITLLFKSSPVNCLFPKEWSQHLE